MASKVTHTEINLQIGEEISFTQTEWQGIPFKNLGVRLDPHKLPSNNFYNEFYRVLFNQYENFEGLPKTWLNGKESTARGIFSELENDAAILSFGCGIGYIEACLIKLNSNLNIDAYDFSDTASKWIKRDFPQIRYMNHLSNDKNYDFIYLSQLLYALEYKDCIKLLCDLKLKLKPNGRMLIINTSTKPSENGFFEKKTLIGKVKKFIRPTYRKLLRPTNKHKQFWGWERDNDKYFEILNSAGMKIIKSYALQNQSFIVSIKK
jgi:2-polyprenyl-3-methyl-5-hydroxy-6-metoxy-1,4-benzoquinol methylase